MSSDTENADKPHSPSQKKLLDARKKGEIAKSTDLNTAAIYLGFLFGVMALGAQSLQNGAVWLRSYHTYATDPAFFDFDGNGPDSIAALFQGLIGSVGVFFLLPIAFFLASTIGQRAIVFAPDKLRMKLSRISPISNFKNKFGKGGLFEFLKSTVKMLIFFSAFAIFLSTKLESVIGLSQLPSAAAVAMIFRFFVELLIVFTLVSFVISSVDYLWQVHLHMQKHRMSDKELKDEVKESEGDPHLKSARRAKAQSIATGNVVQAVSEADVVIVNPTHYAVALKWERAGGGAPTCVAKGVDEVARKMREVATEHGVAIHSDPPTARALYAVVNIDEEIAPEFYQPVAIAIRFADQLRQRRRKRYGR